MEIYDAMKTLRAVRRLRPDPIPDDVLRRVLEAATWAPTGGNVQPWRIVVVRDGEKKARLGSIYAEHWAAYTKIHRKMLEGAPEEVRESNERMIRAGDYLAEHFTDTPAVLIQCFNPKIMAITDANLDRISVVGGASIYPAVQNLLLACRNEGLGCVLTTLLCTAEPEVRELLGIPEPWCTAAAIPIGYPVLGGHGPISRRPIEKMVFADTWGAAL
ncbi:MAG: nitroreductase family protein [Deltaproteobacteria bacterium]|nr:nitroreductase family protein [Deltaproteobacteria bacterium]MBW2444451.1 nitroreductase family protein [Deltaproteobacteria bacterium]